jgi:hypothetical protein
MRVALLRTCSFVLGQPRFSASGIRFRALSAVVLPPLAKVVLFLAL